MTIEKTLTGKITYLPYNVDLSIEVDFHEFGYDFLGYTLTPDSEYLKLVDSEEADLVREEMADLNREIRNTVFDYIAEAENVRRWGYI
jgi:hypothetical protein